MEKISKGLLCGLLVLAGAILLCPFLIIGFGSGIIFAFLSAGIPRPAKLLGMDKEMLYEE